jgi:hypothetical protein
MGIDAAGAANAPLVELRALTKSYPEPVRARRHMEETGLHFHAMRGYPHGW